MNKRIKKKRWKQAAAQSRAERLEEIRIYGADDIRTIQSCFGHYILFGEMLLDKKELWEPTAPAVVMSNAIEKAVELGAKWIEDTQIPLHELKAERNGEGKYVITCKKRCDEREQDAD